MDVAKARRIGMAAIFSPLFVAACANNESAQIANFPNVTKGACESAAVPNRFIVRWKDGTMSVEESENRETFIKDVIEPYGDEIELAEHDYNIKLEKPQPVSALSAQALDTTSYDWGQQRIAAPAVWGQGVTGDGVIVAVVDSGVDRTHDQLKNQIAINTGEIPGNGVDDDGNGYIDDVAGYDFDMRSGFVTDGTGHGTHVAGIIAADHSVRMGTETTVPGVAPKAKVLPLDFMNDAGDGAISLAIEAMQYAASRGAKIINASWGGAPCSQNLSKAILDLESHGVLFVNASGNGDRYGQALNLDQSPEFPAAYGLTGQITVGASTARDYSAGFSNYSRNLVNLVAPGVSIVSTYPGNRTRTMDGTSMATPFVSGTAALLWSARPNATVAQIKQATLAGVDAGGFAVSSGGRLNAQKALAELIRLLP